MAEILFDSIVVNTTIQDRIPSAPKLDLALIFDPDLTGTIANLTKGYFSLEDLEIDFPKTTKIYKCAAAHYAQPGHNSLIKVGRADSADTDITESLNNLWFQDSGFFQLLTTTKDQTKLVEIADWVNTDKKPLIFGVSLEPTTEMLDPADATDFASVIAAKGYNNIYSPAHWESGVDSTAATIVITSEVATITQVSHTLRVGDDITTSASTEPLANGNFVVASVIDDDNFTYATPNAIDLVSESIDYFARYKFFEAGLQSLQLAKDIGTSVWAYRTVDGQTVIPKTVLNTSQIQALRNKKYIVYTSPQNNVSVTNDGFMIGGRQIVDETVRIWIDLETANEILRVYINNEKIPYTNPGFQLLRRAIAKPLNTQLGRTGLNPLSDVVNYTIDIPDALLADPSDRQAGIVPPITVTARIGSAVLKTTINITLIV